MKFKDGDLRVIAKWRRYSDNYEDKIQYVQEYSSICWGLFYWWDTIDEEIVPHFAWISDACLGDTGGWTSEFVAKYGKFGRDGIIKRN